MIKLIFPCDYIGITQGYKTSHKAIDLGWSNSYGGPRHNILAPYDGVVTYVKNNVKTRSTTTKSYGNYIKINHGDGITTLVAHLEYNSIKVKVGDKVKKGDVLGIMGNTGYSFGRHCHYEVIINGSKVNPLKYTYYTSKQVVGKNTKSKYKPMFLESEDNIMNEDNVIKTENETKKVEVDDILFEYTCSKSGMYKIYLNESERLIIKD